MVTDVLYRVRPGPNEPLRYSLRSLANVPHGEVFMVGSPPPWIRRVNVIRGQRFRKWRALVEDLLLACKQLAGRSLLLMDDDMFITSPVKKVRTLHAGDLMEHAANKLGAYQRTMRGTAAYLQEQGIAKPLSYELHVPMPIEADGMAEALEPVVHLAHPLQARSLYGNLAKVGGQKTADVKIVRSGEVGKPYVSTAPWSWARETGVAIRSLFPERSRYE